MSLLPLLLCLIPSIVFSEECTDKAIFNLTDTYYPFELMNLPYTESFLEPFLSEDIIEAHYEHHHQTYVDKLNAFLDENTDLQNRSLVELNQLAAEYPPLAKFAGGDYNHNLYWWVLTNTSCVKDGPEGLLLIKIEEQWGSFELFIEDFNEQIGKIFGSGWGWTCVNTTGDIEIRTTANQINPLMGIDGDVCYPFFGIDAWEHAYYLQYKWARQDYFEAGFGAVDWEVVELFYEAYASNLEAVPF